MRIDSLLIQTHHSMFSCFCSAYVQLTYKSSETLDIWFHQTPPAPLYVVTEFICVNIRYSKIEIPAHAESKDKSISSKLMGCDLFCIEIISSPFEVFTIPWKSTMVVMTFQIHLFIFNYPQCYLMLPSTGRRSLKLHLPAKNK